MFPILMDEPDSMKVPPTAWRLLQNAWQTPAPRPERRDVRARRQAREAVAPTPLATLAFGVAGGSARPR